MAARFLSDLLKDKAFVQAEILPLLGDAHDGQNCYLASQYDPHDGSYSLQVLATLLEERYERLDDTAAWPSTPA